MKKIAIWSSLKFTNYGDDLQALAYAMFLKNEGYEVKLFQLDREVSLDFHQKGQKCTKTVIVIIQKWFEICLHN